MGLTGGDMGSRITRVRKSASKGNTRLDVTGRKIWNSRWHKNVRHCVYAAFCEVGDGEGFVKIGVSKSPLKRLQSISTASPMPIKMVALVDASHFNSEAVGLEAAFHERFADRRANGEWFRFDFKDPEDKAEFNRGSREVLQEYFGDDHPWWVTLTRDQMRDALREANKDHLGTMHFARAVNQ